MEVNKSYCFGYFNPYSSKPKGALITQDESSTDMSVHKQSHVKQDEKLLKEAESNRPPPLICYYYDSNGKIAHNPAPQNFVDIAELPYLPAINRTKVRSNRQRNVMNIDTDSKTRGYTTAFNRREIFVRREDKKNSEGFVYYIDTLAQKTKMQLLEEYKELLNFASKQFKSKNKFRVAFAEDGKLLHNLSEIPIQNRVIYVGYEPYTQIEETFFNLAKTVKLDKNRSGSYVEENEKLRLRRKFKALTSHQAPRRKYSYVQTTPVTTQLIEKLAKTNFFKRARTLTPVKKSIPDKYKNDYLKYSKLARLKIQEALCKLEVKYPPLDNNTIENLCNKYGFTNAEIHKLYAKFKAGLILNIAKNPYHSIIYLDFEDGIDRETFIDALSQGNKKGRDMLGKIFDRIDINGNCKG
jgi:hypothetical protein